MPTTYTQAPDDVKELVASTIADYYPDLKTAGVTIGILMAERRNEEGDLTEESALKLHGYPCAATAKVNSLKDRAEGKPDLGRPVLKIRLHDQQHGWFDEIARRHGDASIEVQQAKAFADSSGQTYFGWAAPPAGSVEAGPAAKAEDADVMQAANNLRKTVKDAGATMTMTMTVNGGKKAKGSVAQKMMDAINQDAEEGLRKMDGNPNAVGAR